jgi:nucleotide-binding universal stress UspA family protein
VLVIHPDEREWVGKSICEIDLERILVAHDFSSDSDLALKYGLALAQEFQTALHLLYVLPAAIEPAMAALPGAIDADFQHATRMLQEAVPEEAYLWCRIGQAIRAGQPAQEILAYSDEHEVDLICMGVHGAGLVQRTIFGSNVDRVLRQAKCPVLVVRSVSRQVGGQAV